MGNSKKGTVYSVDVGKLTSANTKLWNVLGSNGAQIVEQLDSDEKFRQRIANFMSRGGYEGPIPYKVARFILGNNMVGGIEELQEIFFELRLKREQVTVEAFPWGTDVLFSPCQFFSGKLVYETHVAFLGLEKINGEITNVANFLKFFPANAKPSFHEKCYLPDWWCRKTIFFTNSTLGFRWYLMSKNNIPNFKYYESDAKNGCFSVTTLPREYEVPTAIENVTKHFLVSRKQKVISNFTYTFCRDEAAEKRAGFGQGTTYVKNEDGKGIWIGCVIEGWLDHLQLTVSRKLPVL